MVTAWSPVSALSCQLPLIISLLINLQKYSINIVPWHISKVWGEGEEEGGGGAEEQGRKIWRRVRGGSKKTPFSLAYF